MIAKIEQKNGGRWHFDLGYISGIGDGTKDSAINEALEQEPGAQIVCVNNDRHVDIGICSTFPEYCI